MFARNPLLLVGLLVAANSVAAPAYLQTHDGPSVTWSMVPNRFGVRLAEHQRTQQPDGGVTTGVEHFKLTGPPGYSGMLLAPFGEASVLEDTRLQLRLRCDRPGVLPAMRVVFPRVTDPGTGQPLAAIVRGDQRSLGQGEWEELAIANPPASVRRHARALGGSRGRSIDVREAYIDAVVLIVPVGPGGTQVWVDELTIEGHVRQVAEGATANGQDKAKAAPLTKVNLSQSGLTLNQQAFYVRAVTHNGEPLNELKQLGFNTVAFHNLPTDEQLQEAAKLNLRLLCPAPDAVTLGAKESARRYDGVIAWLLPGRGDARSIDAGSAEVERIRHMDLRLARPILATPSDGWGPWSRLADGLVIASPWACATQMQAATERRLAEASRYAQPGVPMLAAVPTTHSFSYLDQVTTFAPAGTVSPWRPTADVLSEANAAALAGVRGVWITSRMPLSGSGEGARRMRMALSLLNLRLSLLEPWLRDGARVGQITSNTGQEAVILSKGRTRILLPRGAARPGESLGYVVPGIAESAKAYELTPVSLRPLSRRRVAGGKQVVVGSPEAMVLLTDDRRAAAEVHSRVAAMTRRAEEMQQALAIAELSHAENQLSPLDTAASSQSTNAAVLADVRRRISHSKTAQTTGDHAAAYSHAADAQRLLAQWGKTRLLSANAPGKLESSPLAGQPATIIDHRRLMQLVEPLTRGPNLLPGGDFEGHSTASSGGWRHVARETADASAQVSFSENLPAHGARALRIECPAAKASTHRASVEITSPEVNLKAGQLVEITGLVKVQSVSSEGALTVVDSVGAEELALRIDRPCDWRPFRLLRRPSVDTPLTVSLAVRGPITVNVDAMMVRSIELPSATKAAVLGVPAFQRK